MKEDTILDMALRMFNINTDAYTRDVFIRTVDCIREIKEDFALSDYSKIEAEMCEKHGLDIDTKRPIKHNNKQIFIAKINPNGYTYYKQFGGFSEDINEAHDLKAFDFAERIIVSNKLDGVVIIPYYKNI